MLVFLWGDSSMKKLWKIAEALVKKFLLCKRISQRVHK